MTQSFLIDSAPFSADHETIIDLLSAPPLCIICFLAYSFQVRHGDKPPDLHEHT